MTKLKSTPLHKRLFNVDVYVGKTCCKILVYETNLEFRVSSVSPLNTKIWVCADLG